MPLTPTTPPHGDDNDSFVIVYPLISLALRELDDVMPEARFREYKARFRNYGMYYIDAAYCKTANWLEHTLGMEHGVVGTFWNHIQRLVKRAKKGKGWAVVKRKNNENTVIDLTN